MSKKCHHCCIVNAYSDSLYYLFIWQDIKLNSPIFYLYGSDTLNLIWHW